MSMTKTTKTWTRPQLVRLGVIQDVSGAKGGTVNNGANTNRS